MENVNIFKRECYIRRESIPELVIRLMESYKNNDSYITISQTDYMSGKSVIDVNRQLLDQYKTV